MSQPSFPDYSGYRDTSESTVQPRRCLQESQETNKRVAKAADRRPPETKLFYDIGMNDDSRRDFRKDHKKYKSPHLQADDNILETAEADGLSGVKVVVELAVGYLKEHG